LREIRKEGEGRLVARAEGRKSLPLCPSLDERGRTGVKKEAQFRAKKSNPIGRYRGITPGDSNSGGRGAAGDRKRKQFAGKEKVGFAISMQRKVADQEEEARGGDIKGDFVVKNYGVMLQGPRRK